MQIYRYFGLLSIFLAWLSVGVVLYKWPIIISRSISRHMAAQKESYLLNVLITSSSLAIFILFSFKWLIPTYNLHLMCKILVSLCAGLELITAWVPDSSGIKHLIHHYASYTAALLLPLIVLLILLSSRTTNFTKIVSFIAIVKMISIIFLLQYGKKARQKHLLYQCLYFACFHVVIILAIFTLKM